MRFVALLALCGLLLAASTLPIASVKYASHGQADRVVPLRLRDCMTPIDSGGESLTLCYVFVLCVRIVRPHYPSLWLDIIIPVIVLCGPHAAPHLLGIAGMPMCHS